MGHRLFAGLFLALFLWAGWHGILLPLAAMSHHAEAVKLGMLTVVVVPPGIGFFGAWLWLGPGMAHVLEDDNGERRLAPGLVLIALLGLGIAIRVWMGAQAQGAGYAEPVRHESFTLQMPATVQFGADQITFTRENGQAYLMAWSEIESIRLAGGSKDFTPQIETHWEFNDIHGMRGTVPQAAIDESTLVEAVRAHFGNMVRDRPVERFAADLANPVNASSVAKGFAQFAEWVYSR